MHAGYQQRNGYLGIATNEGLDCSVGRELILTQLEVSDLYGENDWEKAEIDAVLEVVQDLFYPVRKMFYADTDELKARYKKEFVDVQGPKYCGFLEKLLKANNGGDGFFVGSKVSLADIVVFAAVGDALGDKSRDYYLDHKEPKLKALIERIRAIPQINTWLQTRPKTEL
ncbi:probable glutathione S-transferase 5 [Apostichopus japonicus]|uniref:probable glutathione S-transferase 5 n=1 Tax=Stichopus japonicus TaxID=307972 RepID=UPI003AB21FE4